MALSNSQYNSIMRDYERRRMENRHEQEKRVEEMYQKIPAIKEIDNAVGAKALERARQLLAGDTAARNQLQKRNRRAGRAESRPAELLTVIRKTIWNFGIPVGTVRIPDTQTEKKCHCFRRAENEAFVCPV